MIEHEKIAPVIDTQRLRLRPHIRSDFAPLVTLYESERSQFIGGPLPEHAVWDNFMSGVGQWVVDGFGAWAIERLEDGVILGQVAVSKPPSFPELELGWLLFDGFEKQGYALEAAQAAIYFAQNALKTDTLVSYIDPRNTTSQKLAISLGAKRDKNANTPNNDPTWVFRHNLEAKTT